MHTLQNLITICYANEVQNIALQPDNSNFDFSALLDISLQQLSFYIILFSHQSHTCCSYIFLRMVSFSFHLSSLVHNNGVTLIGCVMEGCPSKWAFSPHLPIHYHQQMVACHCRPLCCGHHQYHSIDLANTFEK